MDTLCFQYDSFGSQGANGGFLSFSILGGLVDLVPGDQSGTETLLHLMASGASMGLSLSGSSNQDRFLSERSAIKTLLGHKGNGLTYDEITAEHQGGLAGDKKPGLGLKQLTVPSTIIAGQFAGKNLAASAVVIEGANLDTSEDIDQYRFRFEEGQFVNVEVQGWVKTNAVAFEDLVFTGLSISKDNGDGTLDRLITSWQEFEGYDPLIFDFEIQETGDYVLEVYAQKFFCSGTNCYYLDPYYPFLNYGEYDVLVYSIDRPLGPP